ncbi:hypothetical protein LINPERPRIM_LOCUS26050, partial [Linum perenne]
MVVVRLQLPCFWQHSKGILEIESLEIKLPLMVLKRWRIHVQTYFEYKGTQLARLPIK